MNNDNGQQLAVQTQEEVLPEPLREGNVSIEEALTLRASIRSFTQENLTREQVAQLLWAAQGINRPGTRFRTAPSAGATYPLEMYLAAGRVNGLQPGLYRYVPGDHTLVKTGDVDLRDEIALAALGQGQVREAPAVFIVAADYDRTARRYGDRGTRYVHMEVGHASQNICLQAITYGLGTVIVGAFDDDQLKSVLGLPANENPLIIIPAGKPD